MADPIYRDLDFSFKSHPLTRDVATVTEEAAVKSSLRNLIRLAPHDKPFSPEIASPIYGLLFEPVDAPSASLLETGILFLVEDYEPRVDNVTVRVTPVEIENKYEVELTFRIKKTRSPQTLQLFLPVERLR